jgi:hypothetical protein
MWTWSCLDKKISSMLDTNLGSHTRYAFFNFSFMTKYV